jgi:hypothetical protein
MPRFYLNVHVHDRVERDTEGLELASLSDAIAEAERARLEIMTEDELDQLWLEIMDQTGRVLAEVG